MAKSYQLEFQGRCNPRVPSLSKWSENGLAIVKQAPDSGSLLCSPPGWVLGDMLINKMVLVTINNRCYRKCDGPTIWRRAQNEQFISINCHITNCTLYKIIYLKQDSIHFCVFIPGQTSRVRCVEVLDDWALPTVVQKRDKVRMPKFENCF